MAERRPIVFLDNNRLGELPSGDTVIGANPPGGILITAGAKDGPALTAGIHVSGIIARDYTLSGFWRMWCAPVGDIEVDIWVTDFIDAPPIIGDSIVGGQYPEITTGVIATDDYTGWTETTLTRGQTMTMAIRSASAATWVTLFLETA